MQQIKIQILGAETSEARCASARDAIASHFITFDFRDQKYAVALIGNDMTEQLLGAALAVVSRRIEQRHAERHACAQRLLFDSWRMPSLTEVPAALTEGWDGSAVGKLYGTCTKLRRRVSAWSLCNDLRGECRTQDGKRQAEGRTTRAKLTSIKQTLSHTVISFAPDDCNRLKAVSRQILPLSPLSS